MKPDIRMRPRGARPGLAAWLILPAALLLALLAGAMLGLQPLLIVPIVGLMLAAGVLFGGASVARRALPGLAGWQPFALLVFWMLVVNMPTFLAFDQTGFSREHGLFNAQSLSRIGLFAFSAVAAFVFWIFWGRISPAERRAAAPRGAGLLFALYAWYVLQAPLTAPGLSAMLAVFRGLEWLVAFFLLYLLFQAQTLAGQTGFRDRLRLILPMLFVMAGAVLLLLLVRPEAAYQRSAVTGIARLGGPFTHPNLLAVVAILLMSYGAVFLAGWRRILLCGVAAAMLFFTYSRGGYATFAAVCAVGLFFLVRSTVLRLLVLAAVAACALTLMQVPSIADPAARFLSRGNERESLTTLSERTAVWQAAKVIVARSPLLGEGFVAGPKGLGEVMLRNRLSNNFAAVHAHNEFLQAQISGGVVATLLSLVIHLRVLVLLFKRTAVLGRRAAFMAWSVFLCVVVWGTLSPSLSYFLYPVGVLLGWLLLTLENLSLPVARRDGHRTLAATVSRAAPLAGTRRADFGDQPAAGAP